MLEEICGKEVKNRYNKWLTRDFVRSSGFMKWCPSTGCDYIAIGTGNEVITCMCEYTFCGPCNEEDHTPTSCSHMALWKDKNDENAPSLLEIRRITQTCPSCKVSIEKNEGCLCKKNL